MQRIGWNHPLDGAVPGYVRIFIAACVLWHVAAFCLTGRLVAELVEQGIFFKYPLFDFVPRMTGLLPYGFMTALGLMALAVLVGWHTRWTTKLLAAGMAYWFLIDASAYSDHFYLLALLCVYLAWLPVNAWLSADRAMGRKLESTVPGWTLAVLRLQVLLIFLFHGLNLLTRDWAAGVPVLEWVALQPETSWRDWLIARPEFIRSLAIAYALWNLAVGFLLWWKRTRLPAAVVAAVVLLLDACWWHIGPAPIVLLGLLPVYFAPEWPREMLARLAPLGRIGLLRAVWAIACRAGRIVDRAIGWFDDTPVLGAPARVRADTPNAIATAEPFVLTEPRLYIALALLLCQIVLPARNLWPASRDVTAARSRFAWCGQTQVIAGNLEMSLEIPSRDTRWNLDPGGDYPIPLGALFSREEMALRRIDEGALRDLMQGAPETFERRLAELKLRPEEASRIMAAADVFSALQLDRRQYVQLTADPEFIRQYAIAVSRTLESLINAQVTIHADLERSVNYRPFRSSLDPDTNLAAIASPFDLPTHLLPIETRLPDETARLALAREFQAERATDWQAAVAAGELELKEAVKLPGISPEDEEWFRRTYPE